jgi:hypothetical protein
MTASLGGPGRGDEPATYRWRLKCCWVQPCTEIAGEPKSNPRLLSKIDPAAL